MGETKRAQHTALPWRVFGEGRAAEIDPVTVVDSRTWRVCDTYDDPEWDNAAETREEAEANAALIVRAVNAHEDLLAVARAMSQIPSRDCPWGCDAGHRQTCPVVAARAALAKATGSPPEDEDEARLQRVRASMDADDAVARVAPCPECGALPQEDCIEPRSRMRLAHCHSGRRTAALAKMEGNP